MIPLLKECRRKCLSNPEQCGNGSEEAKIAKSKRIRNCSMGVLLLLLVSISGALH